MKKLFKILAILTVPLVIQGCGGVSGMTKPNLDEAADIEIENLRAIERENYTRAKRKGWRECKKDKQIAYDSSLATKSKYVDPPCLKEMEEYLDALEKEKKESKNIILPRNLGLSVEEVSRMSTKERCDKVVAQSVAGKSIEAVLGGPGTYEERKVYYDGVRGECVTYNAIRELRRFRLSDYFYPLPRYGYRNYGVGVEVGRRATPRRSYRDSSKCTKMPGFYNCSPNGRSGNTRHYSGGYGNHPGVYRQNNSLVYNNPTFR